MDISNHHRLGIFVVVSLGIFIIIIFIRIWFISYHQDQIIILRGVLDEADNILGELPGTRVSWLLYSYHMGGLQMDINIPFLIYFH